MKKCSILDCTLRDGGYINNFDFGFDSIKDIVFKLSSANTDIIECGFLKSGVFDNNKTLYGSIECISKLICPKKENTLYVAMIAFGDIKIDEVCDCQKDSIDGIRLTFHKDRIKEAFDFGRKLKEKKYKVFMQPVGTTSYSNEELTQLIHMVNEMEPFAFYMVDTLGAMFRNDLINMVKLVDSELNKDIQLGFHSHNNLQLSFANAIELLSFDFERNIIIDSSVFGMGRGAGNLCTELIMKYINQNIENKYDVVPVLEIYDEHINKILLKYKWGYSLPYFIASMNNCHPNYATHLINKQTISIKEINHILSKIDEDKKSIYNKSYIEDLYLNFQKHNIDDSLALKKIKADVCGRKILILAPGKSVKKEIEKISKFCNENNPLVFSVNFIPENIISDYLFLSNQKRIKNIRNLRKNCDSKIIITSNIAENFGNENLVINYSDYLNEEPIISDNAGLMLINLLSKMNVKEVSLAGFDGFSSNSLDNYYDSEYMNSTEFNNLIEKTNAISERLNKLKDIIKINFVTESRYNEKI